MVTICYSFPLPSWQLFLASHRQHPTISSSNKGGDRPTYRTILIDWDFANSNVYDTVAGAVVATMSLEPKKNGGPNPKFWDLPDIITSLEAVKGWLCKNAKKVRRN